MRSHSFRPALHCLGLLLLLLAAPAPILSQASPVPPETGATTVVVVRHAEKAADDPRDPSLSPAGRERAEALLAALEDAEVAALYTTQYRRTRETAEPLSRRFGLSPVERPVSAAGAGTYARDLAREILTTQRGKTVVVVGHSNTVPEIVEALSGREVAPLTEADYDHVYLVVASPSGPARLLRTRFGERGS